MAALGAVSAGVLLGGTLGPVRSVGAVVPLAGALPAATRGRSPDHRERPSER